MLVRLAAILNAHARDIDVIARFGGEEFVVLLPRASGEDADAARRDRVVKRAPARNATRAGCRAWRV